MPGVGPESAVRPESLDHAGTDTTADIVGAFTHDGADTSALQIQGVILPGRTRSATISSATPCQPMATITASQICRRDQVLPMLLSLTVRSVGSGVVTTTPDGHRSVERGDADDDHRATVTLAR